MTKSVPGGMAAVSVLNEGHPAEGSCSCLSIVIPALNEESGVAGIVERIESTREALKKAGIEKLEIIVVDDGSTDRTREIVTNLPGVVLIRHEETRGYGAALKTGFLHAQGGWLGFLDADGTYPPEHFPNLCQMAAGGSADMVVGSRRSGSESQMPRIRRLGNFIWSSLVSLLGSQRIVDPASGMRVLRRSALSAMYPLPDGLNFTPVMSTRAVHEGLTVVETPIPYEERRGRSKLRIFSDGLMFLTTIVWTVLEYNPVKVLGLIGLVFFGASVLLGAGLLALRLQGVTVLGPWGVLSVYASLILGVTGVSVITLAVTFGYLVRLFRGASHPSTAAGPAVSRIERYLAPFGWFCLSAGLLLGTAAMALGLNGWQIERLWLWLVGSALAVLVGTQILISWIVMRVLAALDQRRSLACPEQPSE